MRSKKSKIRPITPDPLYGSTKITKLINRSMRSGKKSVAQKQVYLALEKAAKKLKLEPLQALEKALGNIAPKIEVRSRRVGGATYQVPTPVSPHRANSLSIRWLVIEANKLPNKKFRSYAEKLANEIINACEGQSNAVSRRETSHKMAEANKAFAHFRW